MLTHTLETVPQTTAARCARDASMHLTTHDTVFPFISQLNQEAVAIVVTERLGKTPSAVVVILGTSLSPNRIKIFPKLCENT